MNIQALRYIVQIDRIQSISKAAQFLYVSQSTLSRAVREIEDTAGIVLFERTNKGVVATHDGKLFIQNASSLLEEIDRMERQYFMPHTHEETTLLVGSQRSSPAVEAFTQFYQNYCVDQEFLNIALQEGTRENILQLVHGGMFQLGVVHYISNEEDSFLQRCQELELCCHLLAESAIFVQIRTQHPLAGEESISLELLEPYPHITFADEDLTGINYCSDIRQYNRNVLKKRIVVQDRGTLRHIISNTNGYYLGNYAQCNVFAQGSNTCVPLRDCALKVRTVYLYQDGHKISNSGQQFLQLLREIFRKEAAGLGRERLNCGEEEGKTQCGE